LKVYAETSAVLRWLFNESGGDEILERLRSSEKVVCSRLTLIESHRSIHRAIALRELAEAEAAEVRAAVAQSARTLGDSRGLTRSRRARRASIPRGARANARRAAPRQRPGAAALPPRRRHPKHGCARADERRATRLRDLSERVAQRQAAGELKRFIPWRDGRAVSLSEVPLRELGVRIGALHLRDLE
jgi:hypothetical protein